MGTPIEHNSGKPTYESPCVTRKATKEELEEIDRQLHEKNPFGIDTNVKAPFPIPRKPKKEEPKEPKLTRQEIYTRKWQEARRLALEGLTKHEVSEKMGIPVKTLEKYAKRNDFKYAHKPHVTKEKPPKADLPTDGIKTQERANMEELKPIQKTAEALSQSIRAKETLIDKIVEPDGAVDLEKLMGKLEKEDVVNHPSHYTTGKIEVIDFIEDKGLDYHRANAIKYICRAGLKNPAKRVEDLQKAVWYLNRLIGKWKIEDNL
jgi:hypothetical protein